MCGLLVLGTRYVPVVALVPACALGVWAAMAIWRRAIPDPYAVAQQIDEQAGLDDHVATAYYFSAPERPKRSPGLIESQYRRASSAARDVEPEAVYPRRTSSEQRAAARLVAIAVLLLALRAVVPTPFTFEPPLATLLLGSIFGHTVPADSDPVGVIATPPTVPPASVTAEEDSADIEVSGSPGDDLPEERYDEDFDDNSMPEVEGLITVPLDEVPAQAEMRDEATLEGMSDETSAGDTDLSDVAEAQEDEWDEEAQSLLEKLKQSFSNMLETLDMASVEQAKSEAVSEDGAGTTEEASASGEPAEPTGDEEQMSEDAGASMEGGEPGETAGETTSAGNASGEDSSGDQSSGEQASAAGSSDGDKELAEAAEMSVFGALEELYMERAENMKGDVTVETRRAEQTASVPYNQRSTVRSDAGGISSRDEIPAEFRTYIQNYFDTLRRDAE